jgi:sulfite exporter TauE/SafE
MVDLLGVFFIGLAGSMHCIGMCGGFVALYSLQKPADRPTLPYHLLYNAGRVLTYSLLGGAIGYLGSFAAVLGRNRGLPGAVLLLSGLFMVVLGMNMAGLFRRGFLRDEARIAETPFFRGLLRRTLAFGSPAGALLFGLVLGFLPCGLLYPIFIHAASSGGFVAGMTTLAVFGLGTVPAMLFFGVLLARLSPAVRLLLHRAAALLIVLLGFLTVLRGMAYNGWIASGRFW